MIVEQIVNSFFRILALVKKEILTILKDPKSGSFLLLLSWFSA